MYKFGIFEARHVFALIGLCALIGCTETDSFPVFDGPAPGADTIRAAAGTYSATVGNGWIRLTLEPLPDELDVDHNNTLKLKILYDTGEAYETRAVVSSIPGSDTYLVTLSGQHVTSYDREKVTTVSGNPEATNAIALIQFKESKILVWSPESGNKLFKDIVDEISNPDIEAHYILGFLKQNYAAIVAKEPVLTYNRTLVGAEETKEPELLDSLEGHFFIGPHAILQYRRSQTTSSGEPVFEGVVFERSRYRIPGPGDKLRIGDINIRARWHSDTQQMYSQQWKYGGSCQAYTEPNWSYIYEPKSIEITENGQTRTANIQTLSSKFDPARKPQRFCIHRSVNTRTCEVVACKKWSDEGPTTSADRRGYIARSAEDARWIFQTFFRNGADAQ